MSDLTDNTVATTYKDLIQVGNSSSQLGQGVSNAATTLQDGEGNDIPIRLNVGNQPTIILGMGGNSTATLSGEKVNLKANTTTEGDITAEATRNIIVEGQSVSVAGTSGMNLVFKGMDPSAGGTGGVLTTDLSATSLTWKPSGTSTEERVLTESYVSYTGTAAMSAEAVSEFTTSAADEEGTLPTGTPGQQKVIIVNGTAHDTFKIFQISGGFPAEISGAISTGSETIVHLVKSSSSWVIVSTTTT